MQTCDIYGGRDPLDVPAYMIGEIAHCLQLPEATLRAWAVGRNYSSASGQKRSKPLIQIADKKTPALSFRNVVELHVLRAIRCQHGVKMHAVRKAIDYLQSRLQIKHPLADQKMTTDGKDLFIKRYGALLNITQGGQMEMEKLIKEYLSRIERDSLGIPIRLFPFTGTFTGSRICQAPKSVAMDPRVQFGRPCIIGTGIPTSIIAERYKAGDSITELAKDYGRKTLDIEEALRYEIEAKAA